MGLAMLNVPAAGRPRVVLRWLLVGLLLAATTLVLRVARGEVNTPIVALLYLVTVAFSTTVGGLGLGVVAAVAAFLTFNYFFLQPYHTFQVHQTQDLLVLAVFLVVAVAVNQLLGRAQANLAAAEARERETAFLYELSTVLTGLRGEAAIARALAERVHAITQAEAVELAFQPSPAAPPQLTRVPEAWPGSPAAPHWTVPLATARGPFGEIRLWRPGRAPTASEERVLRTLAGQGALALQHAALLRIETQAKILEESDRMKSALLSSVSHELRTPLATIKAAATSLRSGEVGWDSPARADLLAAVEEETDHLNLLVGNLLDMSRIEAGVLRPKRQWLSLAEVAGGTAARLRRTAHQHSLQVAVSDDLPLVPADHVQLDQVFTNLITNAVKFAPPGTTITLSAWPAGGTALRVQVKNQGPPVPAEHLEHIFDKFYRAGAADRLTGTGLGLSICRGIVEAHGGRIWAENLPDGFAFNFTLPLTWDGAAPPQVPREGETP